MLLSKGGILVPQGCDSEHTFNITDENGEPIDVSLLHARFRIADKSLSSRYVEIYDDEHPEIGSARTTTDGKIIVNIKPLDKNALPSNNEAGEESVIQANNIYSLVLIEKDENDLIVKIDKIAQGDCYTEVEL